MSDPALKKQSDSFRARYAVIFLLSLVLIEVYARILELNMLTSVAVLLGIIQVVALGAYFLIAFVHKIIFGRWKQMLSMALAPVLVVFVFDRQVRYNFTVENIQFKLMRHFYINEARKSGNVKTAFHAWYWGGTRGSVVSPSYVLLIYDETDQIAQSPGTRTADWVARVSLFASQSGLELLPIISPSRFYNNQGAINIDKLGKHFYTVTQ